MLALDRPLGVIGGLALFADHADTKRVFYIPTRPRLAQVGIDADELSFVKFRRSDEVVEGGAGFLSFTTELSASEAQLEAAREYLEDAGFPEALLVQTPWLSGKAVLAAALEEGDGLVEMLLGEVVPDLAGTNRATFSALLSERGARLIDGLVNLDGLSPLGVRYELEYAGLRPALAVRLRADYQRVYKELSFGFQFGIAYQGVGVRASVEKATQKLVESGAIQIEVLHFTDDAGLQARVDEALQWFQDRILEDFFQSSLQPPIHEDLLNKAIDAATELGMATLQEAVNSQPIALQIAERLGISPNALNNLAGASQNMPAAGNAQQSTFALKLQFTFRDIRQEELKTIALDWSEAHAERRTAAPQGLFSDLRPRLKMQEAEDSDAFWDRLIVNVRPLGEFDSLGVQRLVVQMAYPDETSPTDQRAYVFEPGDSEPKQFAVWTDGRAPAYRFRTEVHFRDGGPWLGEPVFRGAWNTSQSLELAIHPLADVPRIELEVSAGTLKFEETPQVQTELRFNGEPVGSLTLTPEQPVRVFRYRPRAEPVSRAAAAEAEVDVPRPQSLLEARNTWFFGGGVRVQGEWSPVSGTALLVGGPWRGERTIRVFPILPEDFIEALVTLSMTAGGRTQSAEVRFESGERRAKSVKLPFLSETAPPVTVDVLVIRGDGSTFIGMPYETLNPVIIVRDREGEHRQLSVRLLSGPSLFALGLMAVQVQLLDPEDQSIDSVVFTESQLSPGTMLAPVDDDSPKRVRYRVIRYSLTGSPSISEPAETTESELVIPAVAGI